MKNKFGLGLLVLFVGLIADAQIYAPQTLSVPTINLTGTTNLASPPLIGPLKQQNFVLSVTTYSVSPGSTNTYVLQPSYNGTFWDTNALSALYVTNVAIGGGTNCWTRQINAAGYGYYRISAINTLVATGNVTNIDVGYSIKISAP
jgi:hypothetical protein